LDDLTCHIRRSMRKKRKELQAARRCSLDARQYSLSSELCAACSSFRFCASTFGYDKSKSSKVSTIAAASTKRVNHLLSSRDDKPRRMFGRRITNHVFRKHPCSRPNIRVPRTSAAENFQFFSGCSNALESVSSVPVLKGAEKNLAITIPLWEK